MVVAAQADIQPIGEKRVTLRGLTWQAYQQILHALPQTRAARLTYDRGTLEITMPLEDHEFALRLIELFVRILVVEMGMKIKTMGSTTMAREELERGSEPDCAYYIQNQPKVAGRHLTYLLFLKERGFLNASLGCATEIVLPSLHVRLKSPNALWRLVSNFNRI
jgi:Uma2 family endonuclease